jgi:hypothetical protein
MRVRNPWAFWNSRRKVGAAIVRDQGRAGVAEDAPNAGVQRPGVVLPPRRQGLRPQQPLPVTTPALDPHPAPMEMFLRHGPGTEKEGQRVARRWKCACGEFFFQAQLNPAWLDRMPGHQSATFVTVATTIDKDGTVWLPKACPRCERRDLNTPPQKELTT